MILEENTITGAVGRPAPAIRVEPSSRNVYVAGNHIGHCRIDLPAPIWLVIRLAIRIGCGNK